MNRREFLSYSALATALGAGAAAYGKVTDTIQTSLLQVKVPNLPPSFEGYRVGFLADTHLGSCTEADLILSAARILAAEKPDILLLGGDYIWRLESTFSKTALYLSRLQNLPRPGVCFGSNEEHAPQLFELFADLLANCQPPDGVFGVVGNHDRGVDARICRAQLERRGIQVLINSAAQVRRGADTLRLIGYDDLWTGIPSDVALPPRSAKKSEVRIAISHNPDLFPFALRRWKADFDVGLAGHTHGGQIKLPLLGALFYNVQDLRFAEGIFEYEGRTFFTTRGVGTVLVPLRINCPPEVSILTLRSA